MLALLTAMGMAMATAPAMAQGANVIIKSGDAAITTVDLEAELQRMSPEARTAFLDRPDSMGQLASNLLIRRALAKKAEQQSLDKNAVTQAALQIARDQVLSNVDLNRLDQLSTPASEVLDASAKSLYLANPARFAIPEQVRVRHLLIGPVAGGREKAEKLLEDLKNGADFEALVKENSIDGGTKDKGGDLGFFGRKKMLKEFEDAAFALKNPGDLSPVVETQFGFHIIKLEARIEPGQKSFDEVKDQLRTEALMSVRNDARSAEGKRIMDKAQPDQEALQKFIDSQKGK